MYSRIAALSAPRLHPMVIHVYFQLLLDNRPSMRRAQLQPSCATAAAALAATAKPWIRYVSECVAEKVEAEDDETQSESREEDGPPVTVEGVCAVGSTQVSSPRWRGPGDADTQEADGRLGKDSDRQEDAAQDNDEGGNVWKDV